MALQGFLTLRSTQAWAYRSPDAVSLDRRLKFAITCEQIFGTSCFAYIQNQPKLEPRCKKGVFITLQ